MQIRFTNRQKIKQFLFHLTNKTVNSILILQKRKGTFNSECVGLVDYARDITYYAILLCSSKQPIILFKSPIIPTLFLQSTT